MKGLIFFLALLSWVAKPAEAATLVSSVIACKPTIRDLNELLAVPVGKAKTIPADQNEIVIGNFKYKSKTYRSEASTPFKIEEQYCVTIISNFDEDAWELYKALQRAPHDYKLLIKSLKKKPAPEFKEHPCCCGLITLYTESSEKILLEGYWSGILDLASIVLSPVFSERIKEEQLIEEKEAKQTEESHTRTYDLNEFLETHSSDELSESDLFE